MTILPNLSVTVVKKHHTIRPQISVASPTLTQPFRCAWLSNKSHLARSLDYLPTQIATIQISDCY